MSSYQSAKALHAQATPFAPLVPVGALPYIAILALAAFFALAFLFTTLPRSKNPLPELGSGLAASVLAGGGVVALFCTLGVYV